MAQLRIDKPGDYPLAHRVVPASLYLVIFAALLALTGLTVWVASHHLGDPWNDVVAMAIAITKATLVVLFFMHVKYGTRMIHIVAAGGFLWLLLLFGLTMQDYLSRGWMGAGTPWR